MSINITRNENSVPSVKKIVAKQPRDAQGRFVSMPVRCDIPKAQDVDHTIKSSTPLYMNEVEWTAPYIYNFVKDNGVVKALIEDGDLRGCLYLNKDTESYYLFFASHYAFGFHLSCGVLAEVLNNEDTVKLVAENNILYWDAIQKV
jgi:hypothetical protein